MHPFNQALLQRAVELLSALRDIVEEQEATLQAPSVGTPPAPSMQHQPAMRWTTPPYASRWRVIDTPRGEQLVKAAVRYHGACGERCESNDAVRSRLS